MSRRKKWMTGIASLAAAVSISACSNEEEMKEEPKEEPQMQEEVKEEPADQGEHAGHEGMDHSGSGEIPEGLMEAEAPTYEVGSQAMINADHMPGMNGAEATISGAFDTTVYTVSYTPATVGEKVTDHKWVIHEELKDAGDEPLNPGDKSTLEADHMEGMKDAEATIDSAEETTVYMVDYTPTTGGEKVTNHKWVTESELAPVK
ncbi:hypothetical protein JOC78_000701 [Bacillus ectoiniformans]|uniref:YdhK family protein n=1 Tax=Bacillus ectoiniformans TaxID=1494429 RepID=UPI001EF950AB|nr:YdhK family protein [Bacillus ectoiniformans]MBM7647761.1 hypothetical protein [Bacillus ectoiniformans]